MQIVAIIILGGLGLFIVGTFVFFLTKSLWQDRWALLAGIGGIGAFVSGVLVFLCLILYALGNNSPELTKGFIPTVIVFGVCVGICILVSRMDK